MQQDNPWSPFKNRRGALVGAALYFVFLLGWLFLIGYELVKTGATMNLHFVIDSAFYWLLAAFFALVASISSLVIACVKRQKRSLTLYTVFICAAVLMVLTGLGAKLAPPISVPGQSVALSDYKPALPFPTLQELNPADSRAIQSQEPYEPYNHQEIWRGRHPLVSRSLRLHQVHRSADKMPLPGGGQEAPITLDYDVRYFRFLTKALAAQYWQEEMPQREELLAPLPFDQQSELTVWYGRAQNKDAMQFMTLLYKNQLVDVRYSGSIDLRDALPLYARGLGADAAE